MSEQNVPEMPPSGRLILTLALIALFSGVTVVFAFQVTREPIARNHREARERAVFEVLPGAVERANFLLEEDGIRRLDDEELDRANAFAGYDEDGELVGVALEGSARGYADIIRVLYGFSPSRERIIGYTVLESTETPGLGQLIASDPDFLANFDDLEVKLDEESEGLEHPIRAVAPGSADEPGEIDSITGATMSSEAVARAIDESANRLLPLVMRHLDEFRQEAE